jgi:hypothetical protein
MVAVADARVKANGQRFSRPGLCFTLWSACAADPAGSRPISGVLTMSPAPATPDLKPGDRVVVVQQIPQRDDVWTNRVEGEILRLEQKKTGSWFAHSRDDRLWLDRLVLRKDDGEIVVVNLDAYSRIEPAGSAGANNQPDAKAAAS